MSGEEAAHINRLLVSLVPTISFSFFRDSIDKFLQEIYNETKISVQNVIIRKDAVDKEGKSKTVDTKGRAECTTHDVVVSVRTDVEGSVVWEESRKGENHKQRSVRAFLCFNGTVRRNRLSVKTCRQIIEKGLVCEGHYVRYPLISFFGLKYSKPAHCLNVTDQYAQMVCGQWVSPSSVGDVVIEQEFYYRTCQRFVQKQFVARGCCRWESNRSLCSIAQGDEEFTWCPKAVADKYQKEVLTIPTCLRNYADAFRVAKLLIAHPGITEFLFPPGDRRLWVRDFSRAPDLIYIYAKLARRGGCRWLCYLARAVACAAGLGSQTLSRMLLYMLCCENGYEVLTRLQSMGCFTGEVLSTVKNLKQVHQEIRSADCCLSLNAPHIPCDQALYCHLLVGRVPATDDYYVDLLRREGTPKPSQTRDMVYDRFRRDLPIILRNASLNYDADWASLIASSLPEGSSTRYTEVLGVEVRRKNLAFLFNSVGANLDCMTKPGLFGTIIPKYEPAGRIRPLLPSNDSDWLRWATLLTGIEKGLWRMLSNCPLQWDDADWVQADAYVMKATSGGVVIAASDFDDYNQLHTNEIMQYIADTLGDILYQRTHDSRVLQVAKQLVLGIEANKLRGPKNETLHTRYGLWSGWRSTTFINSILNPYYNNMTHEPGLAMLFMGDDSISVFGDLLAAAEHLAALDKAGFYAQHSKQLVSLRRAEFLRQQWRDGLPRVGSLIRAISNGASNDLQGGERSVGLTNAWVDTYADNITKRGGLFPSVLASRLYKCAAYEMKHSKKMVVADKRGRVRHVTLNHLLTRLAGRIGGFDIASAAKELACKYVERDPRVPAERAAEYKVVVPQDIKIVRFDFPRQSSSTFTSKNVFIKNFSNRRIAFCAQIVHRICGLCANSSVVLNQMRTLSANQLLRLGRADLAMYRELQACSSKDIVDTYVKYRDSADIFWELQ